MSFNSIDFLVFIALFALLWQWFKTRRLPRYWLITLASLIFYGWWDWRFLILIILSGTTDFFTGIGLEKYKTPLARKCLLGASIAVNLGTLAIFKYAPFIAGTVDDALGTTLKAHIPAFMLILPLGISFYTFQSLSYTIDVYRGHIKATRSYIHFFAFLSLFPQLVAGPIIRATSLLWRMEETPHTTEPQRFAALRLIVAGYMQKLLVADNLAIYVDKAFANPQASSGTLFWWGVMAAFAIQIYFDFAGYSNIARGLLKYMGWNITANFRFPYLARGHREFWNRWHISLSHWFRDYVYIPLGGSRRSKAKQYAALWTTMLASGLWHGANWTFLAWGALHALFVSVERATKWPQRLPKIAAIAATILLTTIAWVFFRAASFSDAAHIVRSMLSPRNAAHVDIDFPAASALFFVAFEAYSLYLPLRTLARHHPRAMRGIETVLLAAGLAIAITFRGPGHGFIYFQF